MEILFSAEGIISLLTLTILEIILGIDNIVFIAILTGKLKIEQQKSARMVGLGLALFTRVLLLLSLSYIMRLTQPLFNIYEYGVSGRDLILGFGGLFLLYKSSKEIYELFDQHNEQKDNKKPATYLSVVLQIAVLDIIFSLDSVITAIGLANQLIIMVVAIVIAIIIMMTLSEKISAVIMKYQSLKVLALSFLNLIGVSLVAEAMHFHIPKGYLYFSIGFSLFVEFINIQRSRKGTTA
jgi:predicted tellurium resistance membrane protein TerC